MMMAATSQDLKDAFDEHLEVTKMQVTRLEQVFELLGEQPQAKNVTLLKALQKKARQLLKKQKMVLQPGM